MPKITDLPKLMERRYEEISGESWSELEKRVREEHKVFFEIYDSLPREVNTKKWWQIWK